MLKLAMINMAISSERNTNLGKIMLNPNVVVKNIVNQPNTEATIALIARILLAYIFLVAGWGKLTAYSATIGYMESMGVPGAMLPLTILVEFGGGLALLFGFQARLAVFSLITAFLFHGGAEDGINFMKNFAMAGGLFFLMLQGAGKFSLDHIIEK
jgi:putative oxidoreductase